jgi:hypothetical protein
VSNGIYDVSVDNTGDDIGTYTVATGANNPTPDENVLYDGAAQEPGTTYLTVVDFTDPQTPVEYTSSSDPTITADAGYTLAHLDNFNPVVTQISPTQVDTTWNVRAATGAPIFNVLQSIQIVGTTVQDSMVKVTTTITNLRQVDSTFAIRYLWDIQVANNDGAQVRTVDPTGSWLTTEQEWYLPTFKEWEATDNPTNPTFSIFGSVINPTGATQPSPLQVTQWTDSFKAPFEYTVTPTKTVTDSAILYYWGPFVTAANGGIASVTAFLFTVSPTVPVTPSTPTSVSTTGTIPMQTTGAPLGLLLVGLAVAVGGALYPRIKN